MQPKKMNPIEKLLKTAIANQVIPYGYDIEHATGYSSKALEKGSDGIKYKDGHHISGLINFLKSTAEGIVTDEPRLTYKNPRKNKNVEEWRKIRHDLFRIGLGLPQKYGSMKISDYKPTKGNVGKDEVFYDFKDRSVDLKGALGNYKTSSPKDSSYQSYYDIWDLEMPAIRGNRTKGWIDEEYKKQGAVQSLIDMLFTPPKIYGRDYSKP